MSYLPPAANLWDVDEVAEIAAQVLRVSTEDVDMPLVERCAAAATELIDCEVDMVPVDELEDPFDAGAVPTLVQAAAKLTAHLYLNPATDPASPPDPVAVVRAELSPWRARFGVA